MLCCLIHSFSQSTVKYLAKADYGQGFVKDAEIQGESNLDMVPTFMSGGEADIK